MKNAYLRLFVASFIAMLLSIFISTSLMAQMQMSVDLMYFPDPEKKISMDFKDVSLRDILKAFSQLSGLNFVATEMVQERKITLYLDSVSVRDALDKIFKANNLAYDLEPESNIFIVKELGKPGIEFISRTYYLKYARVSTSNLSREIVAGLGGTTTTSILDAIKNVVSENGKVSEDPRTNSVLVTDVPTRFPLIEQVVAWLDMAQPHILIEVEMLDTTKKVVDEMGLKWGKTWMNMTGASLAQGTEFPYGTLFPGYRNKQDGKPWITNGTLVSGVTAVLEFLTSHTETRYLARPRILTLNNEAAELKIITDEVIGKKQTTTTQESGISETTDEAERAETGVSLRVTPSANLLNKEITLYIEPKVKEATLSSRIDNLAQN